jgi:hypothetical protein
MSVYPRLVPANELAWRKSSYSGAQSECIEVANGTGGVLSVRDSKDPQGPSLAFSPSAWSAFITDLQAGTFSAS